MIRSGSIVETKAGFGFVAFYGGPMPVTPSHSCLGWSDRRIAHEFCQMDALGITNIDCVESRLLARIGRDPASDGIPVYASFDEEDLTEICVTDGFYVQPETDSASYKTLVATEELRRSGHIGIAQIEGTMFIFPDVKAMSWDGGMSLEFAMNMACRRILIECGRYVIVKPHNSNICYAAR